MKRSFTILFLLAGVVLSSCIKEKYQIDIDDNTSRIITEFTEGRSGFASRALDFSTQTIEIDLAELRVPPRADLNSTVQVKIAENNSLVTAAGFTPLPAGSYTIMSYDYTLTPEAKKAMVRVKLNPSNLIGANYAIGLTIQQVSQGEISQNSKDILVEVKVKNDYEGEYLATGQRILYAGPTVASGIANVADFEDEEKYLFTIDNNTVETDVADLIGSGWMYLEVDPATFEVTVLPSATSPTFDLSNNGPCTYDPVTRTFTLNYKYYNAAGNLRTITEVIVAK